MPTRKECVENLERCLNCRFLVDCEEPHKENVVDCTAFLEIDEPVNVVRQADLDLVKRLRDLEDWKVLIEEEIQALKTKTRRE